MLNQLTLIGRIAKDPKLQTTREGGSYTRFTLAVRRPFKNQSGNYDTDFIPCVTWGKLSETIVDYCTKGSLVSLNGRIHMRTQELENQKRITSPEIIADNVVFLHLKKAHQKQSQEVPIPSAPQELEDSSSANHRVASNESHTKASSTNLDTNTPPILTTPSNNKQVPSALSPSQK
ncbi:single-stranded DNA-binding protein [Salipaludibacillus neizhouensis]|uniref:Single-stranded DNA-binding protein n=1 Tax=Salipaludibacillus neizhouensis TaxID=885475 RepID=A0A3A9KCZ1_9BACI|nr:single-stranded DNA-binding protein [Salipaludibacillus neizhouensis]RKL68381.1 single-stranded DNA-binding protein [Salipaludibacillus neizhouensis]